MHRINSVELLPEGRLRRSRQFSEALPRILAVMRKPASDTTIRKQLANITSCHGQMQIIDARKSLQRFLHVLQSCQFSPHANDLLA